MGGKAAGERRPDSFHALEGVERAEGAEGIPVGDDAGGEGGADPGQGDELLGGGDIDVDGLRGRPGRARGSLAGGAGLLDGGELALQGGGGGGRPLGGDGLVDHPVERAGLHNPDAAAEDGDSGEKGEGVAFGGGRHAG